MWFRNQMNSNLDLSFTLTAVCRWMC